MVREETTALIQRPAFGLEVTPKDASLFINFNSFFMTSKKNEKQTNGLQLSRESKPNHIKAYFTQVFNLKKSGESFPVNLDDVWPLVYSEKSKAIRALRNNHLFEFGVDYHLLAQNGEQDFKKAKWGGHNKETYLLSLPCLEYFIARKVRPVFDVYRQVFHQAIEAKELEAKRKHNRLTVERKIDILAQVATVDDANVRRNMVEKLGSTSGYNRLTPTRVADMLATVCLIDDKQTRVSLTGKIMGGN